jgi:hypothetical protein
LFKTRDPEEIQNLTNVPIYEILKHFPQPTGYEITNEDINDYIVRYRKVLEQLDEQFPKPFVLQDVVDRTLPMAPPPMPAGMSGDPNTPPVNTPRPTGETRELEVPPDARPPGP